MISAPSPYKAVKIERGSIGDREYTANWQARNDIIVTINYNFQNNFKLKGIKINKDNLKNKYKNNSNSKQ